MLAATREPTLNAATTARGLIARPISEKRPPASKAAEKRRRLRVILACGGNAAGAARHYSCLATQHPAGLRVHQMRLWSVGLGSTGQIDEALQGIAEAHKAVEQSQERWFQAEV
jgi:hypothetical protein